MNDEKTAYCQGTPIDVETIVIVPDENAFQAAANLEFVLGPDQLYIAGSLLRNIKKE